MRLRLRGPQHVYDKLFSGATLFFGLFILLILGGVALSLVAGSSEAFRTFGLGFLVTDTWNPATDKFGALVPIYGTIATSIIALVIAVPVSFGIALFLTELAPAWLRRPLGVAIELATRDDTIAEILGADSVLDFAAIARSEWNSYGQHVSDWERQRYLAKS